MLYISQLIWGLKQLEELVLIIWSASMEGFALMPSFGKSSQCLSGLQSILTDAVKLDQMQICLNDAPVHLQSAGWAYHAWYFWFLDEKCLRRRQEADTCRISKLGMPEEPPVKISLPFYETILKLPSTATSKPEIDNLSKSCIRRMPPLDSHHRLDIDSAPPGLKSSAWWLLMAEAAQQFRHDSAAYLY